MNIEESSLGVEKKGKLQDFNSIQEIIDLLKEGVRVSQDEEYYQKIQKEVLTLIETSLKTKTKIPVVAFKMAMQSVGYQDPSMEEVETFLTELKKKSGGKMQIAA